MEDLVRVAFPDYLGPMPVIMVDPIAAKKELSAQDWATAVRDKVVIMDGPTEEHFRRTFNIPAKQPVSDALAGKKARQEMEQEFGVTLAAPDGEPAVPEVQSVVDTAELNARYRRSSEETERILADYRRQVTKGAT